MAMATIMLPVNNNHHTGGAITALAITVFAYKDWFL
jgi:hypothetical protein